MKNKVWYNWPAGYYERCWKPWYKIVRACLALPFALVFFSAFWFFVVLGWGLDEAEVIRKDIF